MAETHLIGESLSLMAIGMGIVFSFLLLLVFLLRAMSWLARRLAPEAPDSNAAAAAFAGAAVSERDEAARIAAISAAVSRYRSRRR